MKKLLSRVGGEVKHENLELNELIKVKLKIWRYERKPGLKSEDWAYCHPMSELETRKRSSVAVTD